jgi:hypothetical protein
MARSDRRMAQDGYKPITEGYQPGKPQPVERGYSPKTGGNAQQQSAPPHLVADRAHPSRSRSDSPVEHVARVAQQGRG